MAVAESVPERLTLASHRLFPLRNGDVAVLSDESTGWCVVRRDEYDTLVDYFRDGPPAGTVPADVNRTVDALWEAGLLLRSNRRHPATLVPRPEWPNSILLKLTGACNFECTYCYDYDPRRFRARVSAQRLRDVLGSVLAHQQNVAVVFHGGEPLLRFDLLKELVAFAEDAAGGRGRVGFSMQTNASRINDEVVEFLEEHDFSIGISLDGATEESNALRPVRSGRSALQCAEDLYARYPGFVRERCGFLAVASQVSIREIPEFALWLQERGVAGLSISFLDATGRGQDLGDTLVTAGEAVALYERLMDMIRTGAIRELGLRNLIGRIHNLFTFASRDICHRGGPCGAAADFLVVDAEGVLRSCDCIYDPYFVIGDARSAVPGSDHPQRRAVVDRYDWLRVSGPTCSTCALFGLCGGTCVAKAIARNGSAETVDPIECALSQLLYPVLLQEFANGGTMPLFEYYYRHRKPTYGLDATV